MIYNENSGFLVPFVKGRASYQFSLKIGIRMKLNCSLPSGFDIPDNWSIYLKRGSCLENQQNGHKNN